MVRIFSLLVKGVKIFLKEAQITETFNFKVTKHYYKGRNKMNNPQNVINLIFILLIIPCHVVKQRACGKTSRPFCHIINSLIMASFERFSPSSRKISINSNTTVEPLEWLIVPIYVLQLKVEIDCLVHVMGTISPIT